MLNKIRCALFGHVEGLSEYWMCGANDTVLHYCVRCHGIVKVSSVPRAATAEWDEMWIKPFDFDSLTKGEHHERRDN